ncbi:uncharacterized protein PRCAT00002801001 [Priceomyces carsonii]|uniref:uncharacterized protein n=1 Tax=Priceomyces carsonii TaxID=28549 RepID=UPI002EDA7C1A|nr:unnamed protein product [Priceomyces carsonii]
MATQKKYVCAFCTRAFTRSEHKQRHERSHTNEKPFHCMHCTSAFVRRDLLQRHCRTVHNIQLKQTVAGNHNGSSSNSSEGANGPLNSSQNSSSSSTSQKSPMAVNHSNLIPLLSITKKLESLLISYDSDIVNNTDIKNNFLIGYTILMSNKEYPIFESISKDLIHFLNSNIAGVKTVDFKVCLLYSVLAIGYANNNNYKQYNDFINKGWSLLISKLIPNYNDNFNLIDQIEILNDLFLFAYTFLTYAPMDHNQTFTANCDLVFHYLDEVSYMVMTNLTTKTEVLINSNMGLFWSMYVLLSRYSMHGVPPKFYKLFLNKQIDGVELSKFMENYSKSIMNLNSNFVKQIVILTLSNELNLFIHFQKLFIFESKNTLHNSIILVNKSINQVTLNNELFDLFKKKLIVNSPLKFHELLNIYVFNPTNLLNWDLLVISLKEFNYPFDFSRFLTSYINEQNFDTFYVNLQPFFEHHDIKNNLVIVSFPLIFNLQFLSISNQELKIIDFSKYSFKDIDNLRCLIIEWYATMIKTIIWLFKTQEYSFILQNLVYLILEKKFDEFKLEEKWFWCLKQKFDSFYNLWMGQLNLSSSGISTFNTNLNTFISKLVKESLNYVDESAITMPPIPSQRSNSISLGSLYLSRSPNGLYPKPLSTNSSLSLSGKDNNIPMPSYTTMQPYNQLPHLQFSNYIGKHFNKNEILFPPLFKGHFGTYQNNLNSVIPGNEDT